MNPLVSEFILLITFVLVVLVLCAIAVILGDKIREARPGSAKAIDIVVRILMILFIYLARSITLGILTIVEPAVDSWIVTGLGYGFYAPMLPCVYDIIMILGSCCSRTMVTLKHSATFILVAIGAKSPEGYSILSYQEDQEMGFCEGECAICLMEYETKAKCALLDKCRHMFHHKCLHESLAVSTRCPLCRQSIKDSAPETKELPH